MGNASRIITNRIAAATWGYRLTMADRHQDAIERAELGACYACRIFRCDTCTKENAVYNKNNP